MHEPALESPRYLFSVAFLDGFIWQMISGEFSADDFFSRKICPQGLQKICFLQGTAAMRHHVGAGIASRCQGTIHWVAADAAVKAQVRLYENIIDEEKGVYNEDGSLNLNPNSLTVLNDCLVEPELAKAVAYDSFQFVRQGFFCVDARDSKADALVFNRIVSLKSSFKLPKAE